MKKAFGKRWIMAGISVFGLIMAIPLVVGAAEPEDVLFYAPFDGSVEAAKAVGGDRKPAVSGTVTFEEGRFGKALLVGEEGARLQFSAKGNLLTEQGTIEIWVKPVDWDGTDRKGHNFLSTDAPGGWLMLFYDLHGGMNLLIGAGSEAGNLCAANYQAEDFSPKEWKHIIATWDSSEATLYVNGEMKGNTNIPQCIPKQFGMLFAVGDAPWVTWQREGGRKTLIDELKIYRKVLTPFEVTQIYDKAISK